jgi:hypothetical protein
VHLVGIEAISSRSTSSGSTIGISSSRLLLANGFIVRPARGRVAAPVGIALATSTR